MLSFNRLSGENGHIEFDFLEREATPKLAMKLGIRLYLAELSLSETIWFLGSIGIEPPSIGGYRRLIYN